MATDPLGNERYKTLEQYSRSRVRAMSEHLQTEPLYVALVSEINKLLQASAKADQTSPSRTITFIIERHEGLLLHTMSDDLRDVISARCSAETLASPRQENDKHARDFLALVRERKADGLSVERRRHFMISRQSKRLLGKVAAHHGLDMVDIVETLLLLGLSDPNIEPKQSVKATSPR
jgi:hypothetical protein